MQAGASFSPPPLSVRPSRKLERPRVCPREPGTGRSSFFRKPAKRQGHRPPGAASALKVVYAAWTKCTDGLVLAIRALAAIEGVDQALSEEWSVSEPDLARKSMRAAAVAALKRGATWVK